MNYTPIDKQSDLDSLDADICWDDSTLVESYVSQQWPSYFPNAIASSGGLGFHYHCLYEVCSAEKSHLEIVFINVEDLNHRELVEMTLSGRVLYNSEVVLVNASGASFLKCAKIIYRFIDLEHHEQFGYFIESGVVGTNELASDEALNLYVSDSNTHLLLSTIDREVEVLMSEGSGHSQQIKLNETQIEELAKFITQMRLRNITS
ncbi:hypothetical protein [Pseudoalteromonas luteoviolacea]|uniref:Uncharacterized protein n=1 Tax=Pseudoalteromonas luteoviolacea S4060-1 TaxID=1365257 RepID=A0A167N3W9_9GAMM|nr:hypothetical protein [Pseudoalteromonas luteoviolacea]KZN67464.1 hypothetical protein N478_01570 [Pseudoalteromonas luteoviolacea S4060-1]